MVPVQLGLVPVLIMFWKLVPVPLCLGIGTTLVLVSGTGTTLVGTGTIWPLYRWYRYQPVLVPVSVAETAQKWQIFPFLLIFLPYVSSIPSYIKNLS